MEEAARELSGAQASLAGPAPGVVSDRPPPEQTKKAAEVLSAEATKMGVLFGGGGTGGITEEDRLTALRPFMVAAMGFVAYLRAGTAGAGPTLHATVRGSGESVLTACVQLLRACGDPNEASRIQQLTGVVWERCKEVEKLPTNNRTAVGRAVTKAALAVRDIAREADEMEEDAGGGGGDGDREGMGGDDEESDDFDLDLDARVSASDMEVVRAVRPVFAGVQGYMRALLQALVGAAVDEGAAAAVSDLESVLAAARAIGVGSENLGASLYPEQDRDEVEGALREVGAAAEAAVDPSGRLGLPGVGDAGRELGELLATAGAGAARAFELREM